MGAKFNSTEVALLKIGKKAYLIYPEKNVYLDLNTVTMKAQLKLMNFDIDEMLSSDMFDFSYFPDLTQATYCERLEDDPEGVKYVFETEDGAINVTMSGKTLVCLESAQDGNVYRIDFYSVSKDVPSEMKSLKGMDGISETKFFYYMAKG
ncbi:MAG: hypothetical protein IJK98_00670, partial [Clostridia bacterium]|nr:hypothetical protein [Clostridia bacterium]